MNNIQQLYTNCLAQGAYFIESNGEAAVIDPLRETAPYIQLAQEKGVKIKYIFETHFHADFVSGHVDLAKKTGAKIIYGPGAQTAFSIYEAKDQEEFTIGDLTIRVLHTPGHTPESTCYLLIDEEGKDHAIFTGDTLFIGDVGRPDLAQKATGLTSEDLAGWLYDSLRNKIMPLGDEVIVYPGHGAGSACGKNMSDETWDSLGHQKQTNYALRADMTREEFIDEVTTGLAPPPQYFAKNAMLNKQGYLSIDDVLLKGLRALDLDEFKKIIADPEVLILDVRDKTDFVNGFIPNSLFIGLDGSFAPWVGALISDLGQKIALVIPEGREEEAVTRLARVGYDQPVGYLKGGFESWQVAGGPINKIDTLSVTEFISEYPTVDQQVVDVRKPGEFDTTRIVGAQSFPLDDFPQENFKAIESSAPFYLHCKSGFRATVAASILFRNGITEFTNIHGSFDDIKESKIEIEGSCPSLLTVQEDVKM